MQFTEVCIKPKGIPVPSLDTRPQSHEVTERLENEEGHNQQSSSAPAHDGISNIWTYNCK